MRELEFLPAWYPQARRRRRTVLLQGWLTVLFIVGMGAYVVSADRSIRSDERALACLRDQVRQTDSQLAEMDKLDTLLKQWRQQDQVVSRLGLYVEACTMMQTLDSIMPRQMALVGVQLDNEEKAEQSAVLAARAPGSGGEPPVDRRLKVRVQGVCPTDVDLANFVTRLADVPFFELVTITYAREKSENNHVMREFEVTFSINLNGQGP